MTDNACIGDHDEREPALDGLLLCGRHRRRMDTDVTEIGLLIVDSQRIVDGGAPQEEAGRSFHSKKRADPPAPGDVLLMSLFDPATKAARLPDDDSEPVANVLGVVASWLLLVAEERPLTATLPKSVLGQLDLLKRHHEWLAAQPYADDYLLELGELRKALAGAVRDHRFERRGVCRLPVEEKDGPCGGTLLEENGTRVVSCRRCGARWVTEQELARLAVSLEAS